MSVDTAVGSGKRGESSVRVTSYLMDLLMSSWNKKVVSFLFHFSSNPFFVENIYIYIAYVQHVFPVIWE